MALVQSTKANAEIVDVDWSKALKMAGVLGKVDASDVPASNETGLWRDEEVFRTKTVRIECYTESQASRLNYVPGTCK